jgi:hypothetical protein
VERVLLAVERFGRTGPARMEIVRVGLAESWRRGLRVATKQ